MKKRIFINVEVPSSLRRKYKKACYELGTIMKFPILKAINDTIKKAHNQ